VFSGSTGEGLEKLADDEGAAMIVFGSDYRTPPGRAEPGTSAQGLMEGGSVAIAVAAAGLRTGGEVGIETIAVAAADGDTAAQETAEALAAKLGAKIVEVATPEADLIVVGSPASSTRRTGLSGTTRSLLNTSRGSVLVVPSGTPVTL
jgi:nucleotide-binding universal stress UspA family protein